MIVHASRRLFQEFQPDVIFHLAAEHYDGAEPVNLGASQEISIRDLVQLIV
jgi:nucleoside-diphosphate-sugar epimerase